MRKYIRSSSINSDLYFNLNVLCEVDQGDPFSTHVPKFRDFHRPSKKSL